MIFSKPITTCFILGACFIHSVYSAAYQMTVNGQTFDVNVVGQDGMQYQDRTSFTDDYGESLDEQKNAICSSLRGEYCEQVTNNAAKTHNLFNYFPNHASESVVAHSNERHSKNTSPYLLKQAMDDRTLKFLSKQNPHNLGNGQIIQRPKNNPLQNVLNQMDGLSFDDPLTLVKSKKIKIKNNHQTINKKKKIKNENNENENDNNDHSLNENDENDETEENEEEDEYSNVDVEIYANFDGDDDLANALGLDEEEFGETLDRIVAQLVSSYLDGDSDEVDITEIFANEMSVENGDVSYEQLNLEQGALDEMSEILQNIAKKHQKKLQRKNQNKNDDDEEIEDDNESDDDIEIFQVKFVVETDPDDDDDTNEEQEEQQNIDDSDETQQDIF